jgi:Ser/Thr protein kinase RdoA (MazF antagonist)
MFDKTPYDGLSPDTIIHAIESVGYRADGRLLALNSYENRVYQVGVEDAAPLVVKFYRPGRWDDAAILEEHRFTLALAGQEIPVVAPLSNSAGETLLRFQGYRFALFPRQGGRTPELEDAENLRWLGRFLGRIHGLGAAQPFRHRLTLDAETYGGRSAHFLLTNGFLPLELEGPYARLTDELVSVVRELFEQSTDFRRIRLHGDCHPGNILWSDDGPHFVDMDDCCMAPAVQDLWMLLSGDRGEASRQLAAVLEGYRMFRDFDHRELRLIEALRTLRIIHHAAWLARRWEDPAFPRGFPWFGTHQYWQEHLEVLRQQRWALEYPPVQV